VSGRTAHRLLSFTVRHLVDPVTGADMVVESMRQLGIDVEIPPGAPWIPELERRFKRKLPPLYRSLVLRFGFLACEIGEVELFGHHGVRGSRPGPFGGRTLGGS